MNCELIFSRLLILFAFVRIVSFVTIIAAVLISGCAEKKPVFPPETYAPGVGPQSSTVSTSITNGSLIVTLDPAATGKVAHVNTTDRFVILNFPLGRVPSNGRQLSLYRHGLKVGEVKVTGPQQDDNTAADIIAGDAQEGDEVRDR
jgi:hypothetical protein